MTISQTQLVDILYKKLSGVSKTDTSTAKSPANEANASPQLSPGTTIWQQDYYIPSVTTLPTSNSSVVTVYRDTLTSTVQATALSEGIAQETWATNLTDWIPPQFGAGYQLQLFAGPPGRSNPQTFTNLPVGGSGNSDSWYFDYSAGIVNFADTNVPTPVANVANVVYVVGARYTGTKGINNFANLQVANISINGNTITGNTGVTVNGNLTTNYITGNLTGPQTLTSLTVYGNITTGNVLTGGLFWSNGNPVLFTNYSDSNVALLLSNFGSNTISTTGNINGNFIGNLHTNSITTNTSGVVTFNMSTAITLPVGGNTARPSSPTAGQIRWNSDLGSIEYYSGTGWGSLSNSITSQIIVGDNVSKTFTLNSATTAEAILVSINGTIQEPGTAYTVTGNSITFTDSIAPLSSDVIDIRFLATASVIDLNSTIVDTSAIDITTSNTIIDSWNTGIYRSARYTVTGTTSTDSSMADVHILQNNGVVILNAFGILNTGSNSITYYANISGGTVNLLAQGTVSGNVRLSKTYFTA